MTNPTLPFSPEEAVRSARTTRWKRAGIAAAALTAVAGLAVGTGISGATWNDTHNITGSVAVGGIALTLDGQAQDYTITTWQGQTLGPGDVVTSEPIPVTNAGSVPGTVSAIATITDGDHATVEMWDEINAQWTTVTNGQPIPTFGLDAAEAADVQVRVSLDSDPVAQGDTVGVTLTTVLTADA